MKVLGEYIDHHVKEEQDELFPKDVEDAGVAQFGRQLPFAGLIAYVAQA